MTVGEALKRAVITNDADTCGKIAAYLYRKGFDYKGTVAFVVRITGCDPRDWEALLLESERPKI